MSSLQAVYDAIDSGETTYRAVLQDVFVVGDSLMQGLNDYDLLNPANMITQVSASLTHLKENIDLIIENEPKILLLHYGINHISTSENDLNNFMSVYTSLLEELIENLPNTTIVVSGFFEIDTEIATDEKFEYVSVYNEALLEMCEELEIEFLLTDAQLFDEEAYGSDGIHMRKSFYEESWLKFLIEELELY